MKCFGEKPRCLHCKILLLDDQELFHEVLENTTGQDLLNKVFHHLNLIETAYFGLRYLDGTNQTHWLEPTKKIVKQMKGSTPYTLYFSVKFYAADPSKLAEEITRYQLFLQVKQDILQGRLPVPPELSADLGAYAIQSELGDFDPERHPPGYISEFRFLANQSTALEEEIAVKHKQLLGMVPSDAEAKYLEKVMWLDMYGVDLHPVLGEDNIEYFLGLTPAGVIVLRNKAKVGNYFWPRITKVYFRGKFFMLRVRDKNNSEKTYGFETPSKSACKHLWRCCVEHHAFFRLTQSSATSQQALFSLHSNFSGRTEKEALIDAQSFCRPQPQFKRHPSRKFQRRIIGSTLNTSMNECRTSSTTLNSLNQHGSTSATSLPGVTALNGKENGQTIYRNGSESALTSHHKHSSNSSTVSSKNRKNATHNNNDVGKTDLNDHHRLNGNISPSSLILTNITNNDDDCNSNCKMSRRASSADSQSSVDSRGHRRRRRRSRHRSRSSDCESEGSNGSKSRHRRRHHRSRHNSNDSCDKHRHRRHRHRNNSRSSTGSHGEPELHWGHLKPGENTGQAAMVRDLSKSGYFPSGHETESDFVHHHSGRRRHRKHRSRSRSPSESKQNHIPDELKSHINRELQGTDGLTHAEMKEIPYTRIETAKNIKIKYSTSKSKKHKNKKDKGDSHENPPTPNKESPPPPYTSLEQQQMYKSRHSPDEYKKEIPDVIQSNKAVNKVQINTKPSNGHISSSSMNGHMPHHPRRQEYPRVVSMIPPVPHSNYYHNERNHYDHDYDRGYRKEVSYPNDPGCDVTTSVKPDHPSPQSSDSSGISAGSSSTTSMVSSSVITTQPSQHDSYATSTSLSIRSLSPNPAKPSEFSEQPLSLPLPVYSPALRNHNPSPHNNPNHVSFYDKFDSGDSNIYFYSSNNENSNQQFTLPKPSARSLKEDEISMDHKHMKVRIECSYDRDRKNKLSERYNVNNKNDSLTDNIDLVHDQSVSVTPDPLAKDGFSKEETFRPMPHPRNSRLSPSSDPDYANSLMVQTMRKMDQKIRKSPSSLYSVNTLGIPTTPTPSMQSDFSLKSMTPVTQNSSSRPSSHQSSLMIDDSQTSYLKSTSSSYTESPRYTPQQYQQELSPRYTQHQYQQEISDRYDSLPIENTINSHNSTPTQFSSMTWCRGNSKSRTSICETPTSTTNTLPGNRNPRNSGAHWKVYNWDMGKSSSNQISSTDQLNHIGQGNADLSRRGRRGSAGSLELILGPLIQSALQNQKV